MTLKSRKSWTDDRRSKKKIENIPKNTKKKKRNTEFKNNPYIK